MRGAHPRRGGLLAAPGSGRVDGSCTQQISVRVLGDEGAAEDIVVGFLDDGDPEVAPALVLLIDVVGASREVEADLVCTPGCGREGVGLAPGKRCLSGICEISVSSLINPHQVASWILQIS